MSEPTNRLPKDDDMPDSNPSSQPPLTPQEARQKKLDAIKRAVDAGEYDSEEIFDEALKRMLNSFEDD